MPSRKQRRRELKQKRHEYEFVYVDGEGHELDEEPDELAGASRVKASTNGSAKPAVAKKKPAGKPGRARRDPSPPSWQRAVKRALMLGAVVFVLFSIGAKSKSGGYTKAIELAIVYTVLFIPFTYLVDRFVYRRFLARADAAGPTKKR